MSVDNISLMPHHLDNDLAVNSFVFLDEEFSKYESVSVTVCASRLSDVCSHLITLPNLLYAVITLVCKNKGSGLLFKY